MTGCPNTKAVRTPKSLDLTQLHTPEPLMLDRFSKLGSHLYNKRFSRKLFGDRVPPEGGQQFCEVCGPGMKGGGPGSQKLKMKTKTFLNKKLRNFLVSGVI